MSSQPPKDDDELVVRVLIAELIRFKEAGDMEAVERIHRELRDVISRPVLPRSTVRRIP
jgi:hypothetical protein